MRTLVDRPWFWLLFAAVVYTPFIDVKVDTGNVASDLAAIESLVERHTFFINDSAFQTIDHMRRPDGRIFSQKSPIFHLVAAVPCSAMRAAGYGLRAHTAAGLRVLVFCLVILPTGWLLWLIYANPWVAAHPPRRRFAFAAVFGLASLMTPFAVTLNHYAAAAAFIMLAVNKISEKDPRNRKDPSDFRRGLCVGLAVSASLACDVPPAFMFGAGVALAWCLRPARLAGLALGGAPVALMYAMLNIAILGSPLPPNLHADEMQFYKGSHWYEVRRQAELGRPGYYQASYPRRLVHATVGHKGIYWMMPLLAAATAGAAALARRRRPGWKLALGLALFPAAAIALTMVWAFDLSGGAYLIRHVLATIPPLYIVLAHPALWPIGRLLRIISYLCIAWGGLIAWIGVSDPWSHNTLSAWPPLENVARCCLRHPDALPTGWIGGLIERTALVPANGWLDEGLDFWRAALGEHRAGRDGRAKAWLARAADSMRRAIAADPKYTLAYYHLGELLDMLGRSDEAIGTYRKLLAIEPDNVPARNNLGICALNAGRDDLARECWKRSLELDPGNATAMLGLLTLDEKAGRADPDSPLLREALKLHPDDDQLRALEKRWKKN